MMHTPGIFGVGYIQSHTPRRALGCLTIAALPLS